MVVNKKNRIKACRLLTRGTDIIKMEKIFNNASLNYCLEIIRSGNLKKFYNHDVLDVFEVVFIESKTYFVLKRKGNIYKYKVSSKTCEALVRVLDIIKKFN